VYEKTSWDWLSEVGDLTYNKLEELMESPTSNWKKVVALSVFMGR